MGLMQKAMRALDRMIHSNSGYGWELMPGTRINYQKDVVPMLNSAVAATVMWIALNLPEAPLAVWDEDADGNESVVTGHRVTELLRRPNPHYGGANMMFVTLLEFLVTGNSYWVKERGGDKTVKYLWWVPGRYIEPKAPSQASTEFLTGYEYRPSGNEPLLVETEDVVHVKYGLDPDNPRKGLGPLASLIREIYTDDMASNFTASLMRNGGMPGTLFTPGKDITLSDAQRAQAKSRWEQEFQGDQQGGVLVAASDAKVQQVGHDPDKLNLSAIRAIPEERVTAVLGIPAAVVGLGTGLEQTKVGATLAEMREQAWENRLIPMGRMIAEQVEDQLLRDFDEDTNLAFDLRKVRVLQTDEDKLHQRIREDVKAGVIKINQAQAMMGLDPDDTQDFYVRNTLVFQPVRSGEDALTPEQVLEGSTDGAEGGEGDPPPPPPQPPVDTDEDEDEDGKDYPLWMQEAERIAHSKS